MILELIYYLGNRFKYIPLDFRIFEEIAPSNSQSHAVLIHRFLIIIVIYDMCLRLQAVCHSRIFAPIVIYYYMAIERFL